MKKENNVTRNVGDLPRRLTRAQAAAFLASGQLPPSKGVSQQKEKQLVKGNPKRAVSDNACLPRKKRAALQDVSNIFCETKGKGCLNAPKIQSKKGKLDKAGPSGVSKVLKEKSLPHSGLRPEDATCSVNNANNALLLLISQKKDVQMAAAEKSGVYELLNVSKGPDITDIDADFEDPQLCSFYATDIYKNLRIAELSRRPYPNYMETVQQDITQSMRGILVDWLVEVSEEYKLVPDTLYLTVYLIDWFLSQTYIERRRLQLLGITCMLIASKYEEINAPRIEEFCFITDNTYTKEEVRKMETEVLKSSSYKLFTPTTKTFLRRFLRAAQASYESPSFELEFLANYLAELTLMNYGFLNFRPSMIAASAVFLARWTLDRSSYPWNPTLQHYASYKPSDLKTTVLALRDLQLNSNDCPLTAIRTKYEQEKFKCVAALSSPELLDTLF
ncbi:hypothetical protein HN51_042546 [Arachis hypogaea]|uniref:cyclin-A2-4 n=1 Tax=Arachis hypogaea TaxID=3818 RepID=UPI000DEC867E|nr:cyclin-A2-4 [Arachis hypogaea]XP_025673070.1 cyclin-A2-4 [Arachis hypogaea]QHN94647.1 Cyclin [Arachis hypogaea]QHN94648.1 Cyclin [Arachis hypogaea]